MSEIIEAARKKIESVLAANGAEEYRFYTHDNLIYLGFRYRNHLVKYWMPIEKDELAGQRWQGLAEQIESYFACFELGIYFVDEAIFPHDPARGAEMAKSIQRIESENPPLTSKNDETAFRRRKKDR